MLGVTTFLGAVWLWLLLVARNRLESGRPPSHPGSANPLAWVRAAHTVGGFFGGFLGAEFGGIQEIVALGAALGLFSVAIVPHQKRLRPGTSRQHRIQPPDDEAEQGLDADPRAWNADPRT